MAVRLFSPVPSFADEDTGAPASGWVLRFYEAGTSTPKAIYSDAELTTSAGTSLTLNSRGEPASDVYLDGTYKVTLEDDAGTLKWTRDDFGGFLSPSDLLEWANQQDATYVSTTSFYVSGDQTSGNFAFEANRRVKAVGSATGTIYGTVSSASYSGATDRTTVVVTWDSGSLSSESLKVQVGILSATSASYPANIVTHISSPTSGNLVSQTAGGDIQDAGIAAADVQVGLPRGYISGLYLSNGTDTANDIDIAVGEARDASNAYDLALASGLTKQLDATWAAGTAAGGLFTGTKAVSTTYHVFLIRADADGSIDAGFDISPSAANIPTGYTAYRRIGSIITDGSGSIRQFVQIGDDFILKDWVQDADTTIGTTAALVTLSVPGGGVTMEAEIILTASSTNSGAVLATSPYMSDAAVLSPYNSGPSFTVIDQGNRQWAKVRTNTSGQIRVRGSDASQAYALYTFGWRDYRGTAS